jgi:hypothetical protein
MSMFDSMVRKNGHSAYMVHRSARPLSGLRASQTLTAVPKPYQPGSIRRHCDQLNTQGMARRSSMRWEFLRDAGRLPMLRLAISPMIVVSWK